MTPKYDMELFPTKVQIFKSGLDTEKLSNEAQSLKDKGWPSVVKSNAGGWQSSSSKIGSLPVFKELFNVQAKCVEKYIQNYNPCRFSLSNSWININGKGEFNWTHLHPHSDISCCIYLQNPGDGIILEDPRPAPLLLSIYSLSSSNYVDYTIKPTVGDIVIFPSWLPHKVPPNNASTTRITIASNYKLQMDESSNNYT
jgi:uncharacterized protein (TIGR02466 family)